MPRKRHQRHRRTHAPPPPARFEVGAAVRVRLGTRDPDYPDIPLGGWAGAVKEVRRGRGATAYLIGLNQRTLDQMPAVYRQRCECDDLAYDEIWLRDEDLEPDTGEPIPVEQPAATAPRPLRADHADDRIRAVFGLTSDEPLPPVTRESLQTYHRHLAARLKFPFQALCIAESDAQRPTAFFVTALGLVDPAEEDLADGVLCTVKQGAEAFDLPLVNVQPTRSAKAGELLGDYSSWFLRQYEGDEADDAGGPSPRQAVLGWLWKFALGGVVVGAAVAAVRGADVGAGVGAFIGALVGALLGINYDRIFGTRRAAAHGSLAGGLVGGLMGSGVGALLGAMVPAYLGALAGAALGAAAAWVWRRFAPRRAWDLTTTILRGAALGTVGWAFYGDAGRALWGALYGLMAGAVGVPLVCLAVFGLLTLWMARQRR